MCILFAAVIDVTVSIGFRITFYNHHLLSICVVEGGGR